MQRSRRQGAAGFTLVELLICIGILALLAALLAPALSGSRAKVRLTSSAHELALALRATRDLALVRSQPETFALDASKHLYRSGDAAPRKLDQNVSVQLVAADATPRGGAIQFFADGGSTGGVLRLSLEKRQIDVVVDWLTGRVSLAQP